MALISYTEQVLLGFVLFFLMAGLGATMRMSDVIRVFRYPLSVIIGMLSQFGWMPLIAWGIVKMFNWDCKWDTHNSPTPYHAVKFYFYAIALIMQGATPGGSTSNLYCCK